MNSRVLLLALIGALLVATPVVAECDVNLKPTDTYNILAGKLDCLNKRISALEKAIGPTPGPSIARPTLSKGASLKGGNVFGAIEECGWSNEGNVYCKFFFENKTSEDLKLCLGSESRMVTDSSATFSKDTGYESLIGNKVGQGDITSNGDVACDVLPPLTRVVAEIEFAHSKDKAKESVQFVRLDCGRDCKIDARDVKIK